MAPTRPSPRAAHAAGCPHRPPCPGCPRFGARDVAPEAREAWAALAAEAGLPAPEPVRGAPTGFRHRARLSVRGRAASPKIGLFQEGSHRIVDVPRCPIHHPRVNEVAAECRRAIRETGTRPYAEAPHAGALRAVQIVVGRADGRVQLTLVGAAAHRDALDPLAALLAARLGERLQGLHWNGNPDRTNVLLGPLWQRWGGEEAIVETIGGARVHYPPGAFGQSHLEMGDAIAARVQAWVPDAARVTELYAGCGPLGLGLLPRVARLHLNESSPHALRGLELGLAERSADERARARVWPGPAAAALDALEDADCTIADPPRRGLDPPVLDALCARRTGRLVYVSCGLASLRRDAAALGAAGWRLVGLEGFDAFPYTAHAETLAVFQA